MYAKNNKTINSSFLLQISTIGQKSEEKKLFKQNASIISG